MTSKVLAAAVRLFVSVWSAEPDDGPLTETNLWLMVERLVARQVSDKLRNPRDGMPAGAMQRVNELIAERLHAADSRAPRIDELAVAARTSASHFHSRL